MKKWLDKKNIILILSCPPYFMTDFCLNWCSHSTDRGGLTFQRSLRNHNQVMSMSTCLVRGSLHVCVHGGRREKELWEPSVWNRRGPCNNRRDDHHLSSKQCQSPGKIVFISHSLSMLHVNAKRLAMSSSGLCQTSYWPNVCPSCRWVQAKVPQSCPRGQGLLLVGLSVSVVFEDFAALYI